MTDFESATVPLQLKMMESMSPEQKALFQLQVAQNMKNPTTTVVMAIICCSRIYLGQPGQQVFQWFLNLLHGVGLIWCLVDVFTARSRTAQYNEQMIRKTALAVTGDRYLANMKLVNAH